LFVAVGCATAGGAASPAAAAVAAPQTVAYASPATYANFPSRFAPIVAEDFAGRPGRTPIAPHGSAPVVSPRGNAVAYLVAGARNTLPTLWLANARGNTIVRTAIGRTDRIEGFSPDGTWLAYIDRGRTERANFRLRVADLATGRSRTVVADRDVFLGTSFSPDGRQIAYVTERSAGWDEDSRGALRVVPVGGGPSRRLTAERTAKAPLWGPVGIAYLHPRPGGPDKDLLRSTLDLIQGDGTGHRSIVAFPGTSAMSDGLYPVAWSADGTRLVANATAFDARTTRETEEGWAIDVVAGTARDLTGKTDGVVASGLSQDGLTVLAETGNVVVSYKRRRHDVVTLPFTGGPPTLLARNAGSASWAR